MFLPQITPQNVAAGWVAYLPVTRVVYFLWLSLFSSMESKLFKIPPRAVKLPCCSGSITKSPFVHPSLLSLPATAVWRWVWLWISAILFPPSSARTICLRALEEKQTYLIEHNRSPDEAGVVWELRVARGQLLCSDAQISSWTSNDFFPLVLELPLAACGPVSKIAKAAAGDRGLWSHLALELAAGKREGINVEQMCQERSMLCLMVTMGSPRGHALPFRHQEASVYRSKRWATMFSDRNALHYFR